MIIADEDDNLNNSTNSQDNSKTLAATFGSIEMQEESPLLNKNIPIIQTAGSSDADLSAEENDLSLTMNSSSRHEDKWHQPRGLHSPSSSSIKSFDLQVANWRIESLGRDSDSGTDEEFFDCQGK